MHKRKTSAYVPRNELHNAFNRKISAYLTVGRCSLIYSAEYLTAALTVRIPQALSDRIELPPQPCW
jgi:hypothetical protein